MEVKGETLVFQPGGFFFFSVSIIKTLHQQNREYGVYILFRKVERF